jgi:HK97 gp10 family phage protein
MGVSLTSRLPQLEAQLLAKAAQGVQKAASDVEAHAKGRAPVDTGNLKSSIEATSTGALSAQVNAGAEYGIYQEYGTYKMSAQPFMVPAAEAVRPMFIAYMSRLV